MLKLAQSILSHCHPFDCGVDDLNDFFINDALNYEAELMGKTYCWLDNKDDTRIVAMLTLANAGLPTTHMSRHSRRKLNQHIAYQKQGRTYPAVLIGRLGVSKEFQGSDFRIGKQIMDFVKDWFTSSDNKTGCRFILVDAINELHTISFYERNGFKPLFPREEDEKEYYSIPAEEALRTRMYVFDLLPAQKR